MSYWGANLSIHRHYNQAYQTEHSRKACSIPFNDTRCLVQAHSYVDLPTRRSQSKLRSISCQANRGSSRPASSAKLTDQRTLVREGMAWSSCSARFVTSTIPISHVFPLIIEHCSANLDTFSDGTSMAGEEHSRWL